MILNFRAIIVLLCILLVFSVGCNAPDHEAFIAAVEVARNSVDGIDIRVDPRIELLTVIQLLGGYAEIGRITRYPINYLGEINKHFSKFADHRAVSLFKEMMSRGFAYDAPVWLVLHYGPLPEMDKFATPPDALLQRCSGTEKADEFIHAMREFAAESNFYAFFAVHVGLYSTLIAEVSGSMGGVRISDLEDYYGYGQNSYNIILAPLLHHGGYGPRIAHTDGIFDVYSVIGPHGATRGAPYFGKQADFEYIVWHEFSHSFMNPLVEEHWAQLQPLQGDLFDPVKKQMEAQAYRIWQYTCNEYFVRAVVIRLTAIHVNEEAAAGLIARDKERGFFAIETLTDALKEYEQNRETNPTLKDYMPKLIEALAEAANSAEFGRDDIETDADRALAEVSTKKIRISADPRVELLTAVQLISGYEESGQLTQYPISYVDEVKKHFSKYGDHRAVRIFKEMWRAGFTHDAPFDLVLHHGPPPEMELLAPQSEEMLKKSGGAGKASEFMNALRDFAADSNFAAFSKNYAEFYKQLPKRISTKDVVELINGVESYCGYNQKNYSLILSPLLRRGAYGVHIGSEDEISDFIGVIGPHGAVDGMPRFNREDYLKNYVRNIAIFAFVVPLVDKYWADLEALREKLSSRGSELTQKDNNSKAVCYQNFAQAIFARLAAIHEGKAAAERIIEWCKRNGYIAVETLTSALEEYEKNRETYPTLRDYMPVLIEEFSKTANSTEGQ